MSDVKTYSIVGSDFKIFDGEEGEFVGIEDYKALGEYAIHLKGLLEEALTDVSYNALGMGDEPEHLEARIRYALAKNPRNDGFDSRSLAESRCEKAGSTPADPAATPVDSMVSRGLTAGKDRQSNSSAVNAVNSAPKFTTPKQWRHMATETWESIFPEPTPHDAKGIDAIEDVLNTVHNATVADAALVTGTAPK